MGKTKEIVKVKIDFNEPHITYRHDDGSIVVGVTTAIGILNKPALPTWGFNQGRLPKFKSINEALEENKIKIEEMEKDKLIRWAFDAGQQRKYSNLYGQVDKAANIGTIAHEILKARELGYEIDNSNITLDNWNSAKEAVKSYDKWFEGMTVKTIFIETPLVSNKYRYGGKIDKYAYLIEEETLIDYKTGKDIYDEHFIQLTGYSNLLIENKYPLKRAMIINMPKQKGDSFKVESRNISELFEAGYFEKFIHCVGVYNADRKIKEFMKGE